MFLGTSFTRTAVKYHLILPKSHNTHLQSPKNSLTLIIFNVRKNTVLHQYNCRQKQMNKHNISKKNPPTEKKNPPKKL